MNWLAHLHLSGPAPATRIGNLLPDLLSAPELAAVDARFATGIRLHHRIDSFTDGHPVFRRSVARTHGPLRRFAGILVDIFYDHFLARDWDRYTAAPLAEVVGEFHASIDTYQPHLPHQAHARLAEIRDRRFLLSYHEVAGIAAVLERLGRRFKRPVDLSAAAALLVAHYDGFAADFHDFYPDLLRHVEAAP